MSIDPEYQLAICELYHPYFHGDLNDENDSEQKNIFITLIYVLYTIEQDEMYDE